MHPSTKVTLQGKQMDSFLQDDQDMYKKPSWGTKRGAHGGRPGQTGSTGEL
jgi:hypothetical protein